MSTFAYTALGNDGRQTAGTLTADNRAAAISQVAALGLHPVRVEESGSRASATGEPSRRAAEARPGRVPQKAVESFTRELSNLLAGGVSLSRALYLLRREAANPAARVQWGQIHEDVLGGTALGDAMAKYPRTFSTVYIAMVRAGEAGGFLDVVLEQIADFRTRESDLKGKVKGAMIYPIILAFLAAGVVTFLLTFFIPRFSALFNNLGGQLPGLTLFIIAASHFAQHYGIYVLIAIVLAIYLFRRWHATDDGKRAVERMALRLPGFGRVISHFALVRFCRMLGTLVGAGVPLIAALKTAREAIGNQTLADTVSRAIEQVQRGEALSRSLAGSPQLFPASVVEMVALAEETGRLDKELVRLAAAYEADLDRHLRMLVAIVEPAMLFIMAGLIGTIVIGMLLPIFNLQDLIK